MSKYRIAFIDEEKIQNEDFQLYFDEYEDEFGVIIVDPIDKDIHEIVDELVLSKCDLVVIDYYLKYASSHVGYNGDELLLRINERKLNIPLILLTSDVDKAKAEGHLLPPHYRITDKKQIDDIKNPAFKNDLLEYITYYQSLKEGYQKEFAELRLKQEKGEVLNAKDKKRVIQLNNLLEEMVDRELIVEPFKDDEIHLQEVNNLIDKTKDLIKLINRDV